LVLGAFAAEAELAVLNTRLTPRERDAELGALGTTSEVNGVHIAPPEVNAGDGAALLLFTSGTTGAPKAAVLPRDALLASARAACEVLAIDASSRVVCAMPLFHVGGLGLALRCALSGAQLVLHGRFDAAQVARELQSGATHASLVAATLARVLDEAESFPRTVRNVLVGGGPVPKSLLERARAKGLPVLQTWGLTETCSLATCERPGYADGATAGSPMPGIELRIEGGEVLVKGPQLMRGYLGHPPIEGFFRTGDLGELDERGRLRIFSRRADLIVSGGENVYPAEIEAALLEHPRVVEVAVLPEDDARWGQIGVAYVVTDAAESELRKFLEERIARYKIPARFERRSELPKTDSGKIDRVTLRRGASRAAP
jgi:O-succinylbenzoic acid--CoA ligase